MLGVLPADDENASEKKGAKAHRCKAWRKSQIYRGDSNRDEREADDERTQEGNVARREAVQAKQYQGNSQSRDSTGEARKAACAVRYRDQDRADRLNERAEDQDREFSADLQWQRSSGG